jgi:hypothetical protein
MCAPHKKTLTRNPMHPKIDTLCVWLEGAWMRQQRVASSQLPSLIMPCPVCTGRLVFRAVTPTKPPSDLEDSTYACERCGTQVIRTTFRKPTKFEAA